MSYDPAAMREELIRHEGDERELYTDTTGHVTGGIGHNFSGKRLSQAVVDLLYSEDVRDAEAALDAIEPRWRTLDDDHARVLLNLSFNLGAISFVAFHHFWDSMRAYLDTKDKMHLAEAADHLLDSKAARQTGARYQELARRLAKPPVGG